MVTFFYGEVFMPFTPDYEVPLERQAYTFEGNGGVGCLVMHGFMGSPASSRHMAQFLLERGITVHCPLLPGHGHYPDKLRYVSYQDWLMESEEGFNWLRKECDIVFIVAHSMGNIISTYLSLKYPEDVCGQIMLAPVYDVPDRRVRWLQWLRFVMPWFYPHKLQRTQDFVRERVLEFDSTIDFGSVEIQAQLPEMTRVPTASLYQMTALLDMGRTLWARLAVPIIMFQGGHDKAAPLANGETIYNLIGSRMKVRHVFPRASHELMRPQDPAHQMVWRLIYAFIKTHTKEIIVT